jgi:hypothetical protein
VEGLALSEMENETAHRVGAEDVGAPAILSTFARNSWRSGMMVIQLGQLAPYQGAAWDTQP